MQHQTHPIQPKSFAEKLVAWRRSRARFPYAQLSHSVAAPTAIAHYVFSRFVKLKNPFGRWQSSTEMAIRCNRSVQPKKNITGVKIECSRLGWEFGCLQGRIAVQFNITPLKYRVRVARPIAITFLFSPVCWITNSISFLLLVYALVTRRARAGCSIALARKYRS